MACSAALALAFAAAALWFCWPLLQPGSKGWPSVASLRTLVPPQASVVLDNSGHLIARLAPEQRIVVPLDRVPPLVSGAFLAVEDRRFREHHGVDWRRVFGALVRDVRLGRVREGASTLTMQLARNVFPEQLTRERTARRKVWEIVLARQIEGTFSKQQILEMYLNQIYLGNGLYGVEAASRGYFGKPARRLSAAQAALLAALPKGPSIYDPRRAPDVARRRRDLVLAQMASAGLITPAEAKKAALEPLRLVPAESEAAAPFFVAAVRRELHDRFGPAADTLGLRVRTTLDAGLQRAAVRELGRQIDDLEAGRLGRWRHPRCGAPPPGDDAGRAAPAAAPARAPAAPDACLEGLFVALDPGTGEVRALVGGRDYARSQFDRVTQARRQAGSTFKPFIYAAALAAGTPATKLIGGNAALLEEVGYRPADHEAELHGPATLREALRVSSNRAAVELGLSVGLPAVVQLAERLGLGGPFPDYPSTLLGAGEVNPLELTAAYAAFGNGGRRVVPRFIAEVTSGTGRTLYKSVAVRTQVLEPAVAFLVNDLLTDVVERGTGRPVRLAGLPEEVPAAGKTGTTNDGQDVWFVGQTPDLVATVWLGFDRPQPIVRNATGGRLAAPVWGRVLRDRYRTRSVPGPWLPPPELEQREIDVDTGQLATSTCPAERVVREWFLPGTVPQQECQEHRGGLAGFFQRIGRAFRRD